MDYHTGHLSKSSGEEEYDLEENYSNGQSQHYATALLSLHFDYSSCNHVSFHI